MTQLHSIHGIGNQELSDRGKELGNYSGYIPLSELTRGEFRLHLLYKELNAVEKMYPELREVTRRAKSLIDNAIWKGLHNGGHTVVSSGNFSDPILQTVAKNIQAVKNLRLPVQSNFFSRPVYKHIGDPIIPDSNCTPPPFSQAPGDFETPGQWFNYWHTVINPSCLPQKAFEATANKYLEPASANMLYEFLTEVVTPNAAPNVVAVKYVMQQAGANAINDIGKMWKRSDFHEWLRLGVKLSNAKEGVGLRTPKESIMTLIDNRDKPGIGNPAFILAMVKILIAAIPAITGMIIAIKASNRGNDAAAERIYGLQQQGFGSKNYSADTKDWQGSDITIPDTNTPSLTSNVPLLIGAGLAAYMIATQK